MLYCIQAFLEFRMFIQLQTHETHNLKHQIIDSYYFKPEWRWKNNQAHVKQDIIIITEIYVWLPLHVRGIVNHQNVTRIIIVSFLLTTFSNNSRTIDSALIFSYAHGVKMLQRIADIFFIISFQELAGVTFEVQHLAKVQ